MKPHCLALLIVACSSFAGPVWKTGRLEGESLLFVQKTDSPAASATLLHTPEAPPKLTSASSGAVFEAGKDFDWQPGSRELVLRAGTRVPFKTEAELHPAPGAPHSIGSSKDGKTHLLFGEGHFFTDLQVTVSYETAETWTGPVPGAAPAGQLDRTVAKLRAKAPLAVTVLGDSISTGANASGVVGVAPKLPGYFDLLATRLHDRFGSNVAVKNLSVGGMDAAWGVTRVPAVVATEPDLVIVAFGMNDASGRRTAEDFAGKIKAIVDGVRQGRPECEFIVVATMTANPEWSHAAPDLYPAYRDALQRLTGSGVAMADVTSLWTAVVARKKPLDLSGNGVNHPNDFGHRLYADVLDALFPAK